MFLDWCSDVLGSWVLKSFIGGLVSSAHLQAPILAFKALHLSPHACSSNVCNLWKLIQGSFTFTPPMDYFESTHGPTSPCHGIGHHCTKARTFYFSTIHHPSFQGFAPVSACLFIQCLQPVETNPRVFHPQRHPWIILRAHMDPLPHAMALGITAPKQRLFFL